MGYNSAEDLVSGSKEPQAQLVKLAEVTSLDSKGRAKVKFHGEDTEAGKTYSYIDGYIPEVGDKVLMLGQGNTFIIMGAVEAEEVIVKYALKDHDHKQYALAEDVAIKDHNHDSDYATKTHSHSNYAAANHTHDYADENHTHDNIKNSNRNITLSGNVLLPSITGVIDIGSTSRMFQNVYAEKFVMEDYTLSPSRIYSNSRTDQYAEMVDNTLTPSQNGLINLGSSSRQFSKVYAQNVYINGTAVSTSDKRKKKFIKKLAGKYLELFKKLRPVTFKYKNGTSGRAHVGFIAQEVEQAMKECGITNEEFGGLVIQDNGEYGLRYEEFVALQTAAVQDLQKKVEELERRVNNDRV